MLRKLFLFFALTVAVLLALYWIYFPSLSRYRELKLEEEKLTKRIEEIDAQIKSLSDERNLLQTDVAYLEKVIREELGFVKPGEIVYELITKKKPAGLPDSGTVSNPAVTEKTAVTSQGKVPDGAVISSPKTKSESVLTTAKTVRKSLS